jgi:adenine-specific DNA-methyltransferase
MTALGDDAVSTTDLPERFDLASALPGDERLAAIRAAFPEAVSEDKIDFDVLRRSLGDWVESGPERFGLTWPGKAECMRVIQEPSIGTLVPMPDESVDWDTTENVIIEGDNLEVLKLMQKAYYGKVKMIYIDPPYNTGKEFIYPDNFREGLADYLRYSGQTDEEGVKLAANAETDGRYHSKWLSMMYPRLFLARNLLRDDGVIFVSIDDHEVHNLRAMMNEIFGEENFVATVIWQKVYSPKNTAKHFSEDHDYIVLFARNLDAWTPHLIPRGEEATGRYSNPDKDPRGPWKPADLSARNYYGEGTYAIMSPTGRHIKGPPAGRYWAVSEGRFQELAHDNRIWWGVDGTGMPAVKRFLSEVRAGIVPQTLWKYEDVGHTQEAKKQLLDLVHFDSSDTVFDTPKPPRLVERMLKIATTPADGDLVVDFFAGSGTTADAVYRANAVDGGNRRYLLVQLPEPSGDSTMPTLAALTRNRAAAAGERSRSERPNLLDSGEADTGFQAFQLAMSNFSVWDASAKSPEQVAQQLELAVASHVSQSATEEAMLSELLLKAGYLLTSPIEHVDFGGVTGYSIDNGALLVCLALELTIEAFEAMAEHDPAMILVLDSGFGESDELKVNALQTVRARNQQSGSDIALRVV